MRGTLWMASVAINFLHAFAADFYWVVFFSCFRSCFALRATQDKPAAVPLSGAARSGMPSEARSAKVG
jgi:hypothetical protein